MNARRKLPARAMLAVFAVGRFSILIAASLFVTSRQTAWPQSSDKSPLGISVQNKNGAEIAGFGAQVSSSSTRSTHLALDRDYQPGDHMILHGPQRMAVRLDQNFSECLLFLPDSSPDEFDFAIPFGRAEKETGSAYAPDAFAGKPHRVEARALSRRERFGYRNLALNPCDSVLPEDVPVAAFPHASTNSYARNLFDFAARNAIDGVARNGHHGVWPYQSWGPEQRLDLWWKLDFGRPVELDKLRLMIRADFPHDSYWKSAVVEFSDGSRLPIQITSFAILQEFKFPKRKVSWFRLTQLVPADPAKWCALVEVEAWGRDL